MSPTAPEEMTNMIKTLKIKRQLVMTKAVKFAKCQVQFSLNHYLIFFINALTRTFFLIFGKRQKYLAYKKGSNAVPENYRTINSLSAFSKIYGSFLGPLLFLLYINHLPKSATDCRTVLYIDHTSLFCSGENLEKSQRQIPQMYSYCYL